MGKNAFQSGNPGGGNYYKYNTNCNQTILNGVIKL